MNAVNPMVNKYPVFPLRTVLFPGHSLPLKIFEARYLKMLEDCEGVYNRKFIISLISSGEEIGEEVTPFRVGTLVEYESIIRSKGLSFITPSAVKRIYMEKFIRSELPYLVADTTDYSDDVPCDIPPANLESIEKKLWNMWISGSTARSKEAFSKLILKKNNLTLENYTLFLCGCLQIPMINLQHLLESKSGEYRIKNLGNLLTLQTKNQD